MAVSMRVSVLNYKITKLPNYPIHSVWPASPLPFRDACGYEFAYEFGYGFACEPITSPETTISTRRFSWRPEAVLLSATGSALPSPTAVM